MKLSSIISITLLLISCNAGTEASVNNTTRVSFIENPHKQIQAIPLPGGFTRVPTDSGTFAAYLRNIDLKEQTTVYLYNGQPKQNQTAQYALLNISVGSKDLQQCADAVMRLKAEFLYEKKRFNEIVFKDNNNAVYAFTAPHTRGNFDKYLTRVFGMCGSASLAKQLKAVHSFAAIKPGDVLIRGGFPGHAAIVMDVAINEDGKKIYLLAQSYMPAQDIHVLINPMNEGLSPWYEVNDETIIHTPEYTFTQTELRQW